MEDEKSSSLFITHYARERFRLAFQELNPFTSANDDPFRDHELMARKRYKGESATQYFQYLLAESSQSTMYWACQACRDTFQIPWEMQPGGDLHRCKQRWRPSMTSAAMPEYRHVSTCLKYKRLVRTSKYPYHIQHCLEHFLLQYSGKTSLVHGSKWQATYTATPKIVKDRYLLRIRWLCKSPSWQKWKERRMWKLKIPLPLQICCHLHFHSDQPMIKKETYALESKSSSSDDDDDDDEDGLSEEEEQHNSNDGESQETKLEIAFQTCFQHGPTFPGIRDSCHKCGIDFSVEMGESEANFTAWYDMGSENELARLDGKLPNFWRRSSGSGGPRFEEGEYRFGCVRELYESIPDKHYKYPRQIK